MDSDDVATREDHRTPKSVGRRKQFKPVRVCLPDSVKEDGGGRVNGNTLRENNFSIADERSINSNDFIDNELLSENCQPIVCPDCGTEVQSLHALDHHSKSFHETQISDVTSCPTPYHQLARELQKRTSSTQLEKNASKIDIKKLDNENHKEPSIDKDPIKSQNVNGADVQIQPVSNHSKFMTEPTTSQNVTKTPDPIEQNHSFLDKVDEEMARHSPNNYEGLKNNNTSKPPTPNAQQSFPLNSDLLSKFSISNSVEAEDFCNLCKKHFCNKYYLRKHKQDVHGISSEVNFQTINNDYLGYSPADLKQSTSTPSQMPAQLTSDKNKSIDSQRFADSLSSLMTGLPFGLPFNSDLPGSFLFPQAISSSSQSGLFNSASTISNLASIMLLNPFVSPLSLLKNASMLQQPSGQTPSSLNTLSELQNFGLNSNLLNDVNSKNNLMYRFPPTDVAASCDLCQKEFCSTYFLKVHKRDKHGIPLEELSNQMGPKKQISSKTTPIFSIDGIEPGENITSMSNLRTEDKGLYPFSSKRQDETCFLCKQQFSSRYSLMMHLLSSHNIKPEGFGLASELMQMEMLTNSQVPFSRSSTGSNKTSERVACNICNKEVCNKYFLKTHKLKVHGIQEGQSDTVVTPVTPVTPAHEPSKIIPNNLSINQSDHKNLSLDQLMQKYDDITKQFNTSMSNEFNKKVLESKFPESGSRKEHDVMGKCFPRSYNSIDPTNVIKSSEKNEIFPNMFGTLDLIAKNKLFDYKNNDLQGIANHYGLFDLPQSFKTFGSSSGKIKSSNFLKHFSGREGKSSDEGSSKVGFDPEAYCEICKKEFCSKYFLKTHKQKIHGLRFDGASESKSPSLTQTSPSSNTSVPFSSDQNAGAFAFDGSSNKGKEPLPSNMTRVTCEICGKELCNKYFLRTHMLKIHGISDVASSIRGSTIDTTNKQEINTSVIRKESSPTDLSIGEHLFHQQKPKTPHVKPAELTQTQNLVIGVKELKQVTEMLLQSTENSSSFDQSYDESKGPTGQLESNILKSKDFKNETKYEKETSECNETKSSSFPSVLPNDCQWREEFSKIHNSMNYRQFDQKRKRLETYDEIETKNNKKFFPNFLEKENEKSSLRPYDLQNRFNSFQPGIPSFDGGDLKRVAGKNEGPLPVTGNCIMQPFELQETSSENAFAQCKLFLPVVQPICEPITLKFTVTPVDH